jgi:hypothetical protein
MMKPSIVVTTRDACRVFGTRICLVRKDNSNECDILPSVPSTRESAFSTRLASCKPNRISPNYISRRISQYVHCANVSTYKIIWHPSTDRAFLNHYICMKRANQVSIIRDDLRLLGPPKRGAGQIVVSCRSHVVQLLNHVCICRQLFVTPLVTASSSAIT